MSRLINILKQRCPRCEQGQAFETKGNVFTLQMPKMHETCPHCKDRFSVEPGFFIGAAYVSYAFTVLEMFTLLFLNMLLFNLSPNQIMLVITIVVVSLVMVNFKYSRIVWMYLFISKTKKQNLLYTSLAVFRQSN